MPYIEYFIIMVYLSNLYFKKIANERIIVKLFMEFNPLGGYFDKIDYYKNIKIDEGMFGHNWYIIEILLDDQPVWIHASHYLQQEQLSQSICKTFNLEIFTSKEESPNKQEIQDYLLNTAIKNSIFNKKILKLKEKTYTSIFDTVEILSPTKTELKDIYLPQKKAMYIQLFIESVKTGHPLRFLLNGRPGTGKTQILQAIFNSTVSYSTIIILENRTISLGNIFDFCSKFTPCVLVIDDLDLLLSERDDINKKEELSIFLSSLDGFSYKDVFVLATTNDKNLVDIAAQRPGRFNLIIDVDEITSENYLNLIKRETGDELIISLFNENIISLLADKKITGAFIVNLIKLLSTIKKQTGSVTEKKLNELLNFSYNGFYKINNKQTEIGFFN